MRTKAPAITTKLVRHRQWVYPAPGTSIATAWERSWRRLSKVSDGEYLDGSLLAADVAHETGLHVDTIKNLLNSARKAGHLEHTYRRVDIPGRGPRTRTHYRIKA